MKQSNLNSNILELKVMTLRQVGDEINMNDLKSIRKWLTRNNITIHKFSSKTFVYKIDFNLHLYKPLVITLRNKNPNNWKEMFKVIANDEVLYNLMMLEMEQEVIKKPLTWVTTRNKSDEKLLKSLAI
jgi:disulfide oxidoreductase YuzD